MNWTSKYIKLVNGDPTNISVWGESAGGSSILHHLVAGGGAQPRFQPKFQRAITQSPAFEWLWDRAGSLNDTYTQFATEAKCPDGSISCLQKQSSAQLQAANLKLFQSSTACNGIFTVGPALDGKIFTTLAPLALAAGMSILSSRLTLADIWVGKFWKIDSLLVSHVAQEVLPTSGFVPLPIRKDPTNETVFQNFLNDYFPGQKLRTARAAVDLEYPSLSFPDQATRAAKVIEDASFVCNPYYLARAYNGKTYALDYDVFSSYNLAVHASDLLPAFYNPGWSFMDTLNSCYPNLTWYQKDYIEDFFPKFSKNYQAYFASHAVYGNPNTAATKDVTWPPSVADSNSFQSVMRANTDHYFWGHWVVDDNDAIISPQKCNFWSTIAKMVVGSSQGAEADELVVQDGGHPRKIDL